MSNELPIELRIKRLLDEKEISDQLSRFVRMLDGREIDNFGEIFAENITFDYAEGIERQGLEVLKDRIRGFLSNCGPTHHLLGSLLIEVDGNKAISKAYIQSRHQGMGERSNLFFDSNGEYIDEWELQQAGWRIVKRLAVPMFQKGNRDAMGTSQDINFSAD